MNKKDVALVLDAVGLIFLVIGPMLKVIPFTTGLIICLITWVISWLIKQKKKES